MVSPFRFAVQPAALADPAAVAAAARQARDLGYEELYSHDHLGSVDPFVPLLVAAQAAPELRVGPLVLNNGFHHPALLARTVATADRMTGGRIVLGIGTGWAQSEHDAAGIELLPAARRVERLRESITVVRQLLDTGRVQWSGAYHDLSVGDLGIRPAQDHVPILVGGYSRSVIRVAAESADVFQFTGIGHGTHGWPTFHGFAADVMAERAKLLTEAEAVAQRERPLERSLLVEQTAIGADAPGSLDEAARRLGLASEVAASSPFLLCGSVAEVVDRLESMRHAFGISHVVVRDAAGFAPVVAMLAGS